MTALTLILIKRLTYRLPGSRPEVSILLITKVEISARLIHRNRIKAETHKSSLCTRFIKTITTGIVCNYSTIYCRTKIITPACWSIRAGNNIFRLVIIKITVFHFYLPRLSNKPSCRKKLRQRFLKYNKCKTGFVISP